VGLAARAVLPLVPLGIDDTLGRRAWESIDSGWLAPSQRDDQADAGLRSRFEAMAQACGEGRGLRLLVRRAKDEPGFNALALPDGTVVVLDGLLGALTEDEALVVLAHEIGHVVHRHGMENLARSTGLLAVAGTVLGDFSTVAATAVGTLQWLRYSRDAERQADAFARQCIARMGIDPRVMVSVWGKFRDEVQRRGAGSGLPDWLSTHPGLEERLRAAAHP
jgi:Zn-dependent protease with chaperone function